MRTIALVLILSLLGVYAAALDLMSPKGGYRQRVVLSRRSRSKIGKRTNRVAQLQVAESEMLVASPDLHSQPQQCDLPREEKGRLPSLKGSMVVFGAWLLSLACSGAYYSFPNYSAYAPKALQHPTTLLTMPIMVCHEIIGLHVGSILMKRSGSAVAGSIASGLVAFGVFLASVLTRDVNSFVASHGAIVGLGIGMAFSAPMQAAWNQFPARKGLVTGLVTTGGGFGGAIFSKLSSLLMNPLGFNVGSDGAFPNVVSDAFAPGLRKLAIVYFLIGQIGSFLIRDRPTDSLTYVSADSPLSSSSSPEEEEAFAGSFLTNIERLRKSRNSYKASSPGSASFPNKLQDQPTITIAAAQPHWFDATRARRCAVKHHRILGIQRGPDPYRARIFVTASHSDWKNEESSDRSRDSNELAGSSDTAKTASYAPKERKEHVRDAIFSPEFRRLWLMMFSASTPPLVVLSLLKPLMGSFRNPALADDVFQASICGLLAIANGAGKILWGFVLDKLGVDKTFAALTGAQALAFIILPLSAVHDPGMFAACCLLVSSSLGGYFAIFPAANAAAFGPERAPQVYVLLFTAFAVSSVVGVSGTRALMAALPASVGWPPLLRGMAVTSLLSMGLIRLKGSKKTQMRPVVA